MGITLDIDELNKELRNSKENVNSLKGFEIISEAMVYKIYDIFGRNSLLSMLYQTGAGPGEAIAKRLKEKYEREEFEISEAFEVLFKELTDFYSIQVKDVEEDDEKVRYIISNYCFLREPISHREKLKPGKALCRINKAYFEVAFKKMLGNKVKNVEINFLRNDEENNVCIEEVLFIKNTSD